MRAKDCAELHAEVAAAAGRGWRLFPVEEAARRLGGLSKYTIHAWMSSGKLRRTKVGSRTMIRESELERVIEDGGESRAASKTTGDEAAGSR